MGRTRRPSLIVVLVSLAFATLGAFENMHEEIIALVPVLLVLSRGLGFGAITRIGDEPGRGGCRIGVWSDESFSDCDRAQDRRAAADESAGTSVLAPRCGRNALDLVDTRDDASR